jgi:mannose-6-phosphate isomerase-like protein (cupin superfamily)
MVRPVTLVLLSLAVAPAALAQSAPARALSRVEVEALLTKAAAEGAPAMAVARMHNSDAYRVNVVRRTTPQGAIAHDVGTEVHYIIEGAATLVTGGTIARAAGAPAGAATIRHGTSREVQPGDIVIVPVGTPHWYSRIGGTLTYLEVRFDVKEP